LAFRTRHGFSHPTLRTEGGSGKLLVADRLRGATVGRYSGASWQAISSGIIYRDRLFEHVLWENQLGARGEPFTFCEQIIRLFLSPLSKPLFLNPRPTVRGLRCRKPHEIIGVFPSLRSYVSSATCASHTASYYLPNFWAEDYPKSKFFHQLVLQSMASAEVHPNVVPLRNFDTLGRAGIDL
jgi:hypothetical protein